jgi:hypothetical protein
MPKRVSVKGKGADLFFGDYDPVGSAVQPTESVPANGQSREQLPEAPPTPTATAPTSVAPVDPVAETPTKGSRTKSASRRASRPASAPANEHASELASMLASVESETIDAIRKVVKTQGREVSFIRLTPEEKAQVSDIVYTYKRQGQKTTENQINRIAINYLLHDYHEHGEQSVLARVLASLLA